jgi:NADPH-dependent curcumin reductase CurA
MAAITGIKEVAAIRGGETVLISAAVGATGSVAAQLAKAYGDSSTRNTPSEEFADQKKRDEDSHYDDKPIVARRPAVGVGRCGDDSCHYEN